MNKLLVNTLIIGAGRSGTTSLFNLLAQQPQVCFSSIKEVAYFSIPDLFERGTKYYHSFFSQYNQQPIIASADTYLLMDYNAISRIFQYNPNMKIIVMLREPVERAYSSYNYSINYGHHKPYPTFLDSIKFEENIESEKDIITRNNLGHFYGSLYHKHLNQWLKVFPRNQILTIRFHDFVNNQAQTLKSLETFLNIEIEPEKAHLKKLNANAVPHFKKLENFLLNRKSFLRRTLRYLLPQFIKRAIFNSKIIDAVQNMNRKSQAYEKLTEADYKKAKAYFAQDLELLKKDWGISLLPDTHQNL